MARAHISLTPGESQLLVLGTFVLLIVLDILGSEDTTSNNTPREFLRWIMSRYAIVAWFLPFALGVLAGHFFHPWSAPPLSLGVMSTIGLLVGTWLLTLLVGPIRKEGRALLVMGAVTGVVVWPVFQ